MTEGQYIAEAMSIARAMMARYCRSGIEPRDALTRLEAAVDRAERAGGDFNEALYREYEDIILNGTGVGVPVGIFHVPTEEPR
jgi:uncharacterized MAPEG superfamily protein